MVESDFKEVLKGLDLMQLEELRSNGFTNDCFFNSSGELTKEYSWHIKEKKKYVYFDLGSSGVFLLDRVTGLIYGIKAYGQVNLKKCYGQFVNSLEFGKSLFKFRWDYRN